MIIGLLLQDYKIPASSQQEQRINFFYSQSWHTVVSQGFWINGFKRKVSLSLETNPKIVLRNHIKMQY